MADKEIMPGQYWLTTTGMVVLVIERNKDDTHWIVNRVSSDDTLEGVGVKDDRFVRQLTAEEAENTAVELTRAHIKKILRIA